MAQPALQPGAWSLEPADVEYLIAEIEARGLREAVELGSGAATPALARALAPDGRLTSVEHDAAWARRVNAALEAEGLDAFAVVLHAPLGPHPLAASGALWYSEEVIAKLPTAIDLLLVDGPPASLPGMERGRAPALPALMSRLAPGALVVLDDLHRPGERAIAAEWEAGTGIRLRRRDGGRIAVACAP